MPNKMLDSLYCECGGKYEHKDAEAPSNEMREDWYQCDRCATWCIVTSDAETGDEISREYEEE